ncbi:uncharacterized protein LOC111371737 isoform X1 [Olea europaea var. sylvestris]|uniref:uncharacterized protein LOC111371737 isoform X1 n=1 Tax=Olea europaea var. sylvestris TaxID=158386 RepID=UPI000C1D6CCF|nr:uncharacterized protein LOC111371737 isoform X1 [Olea europaea var. sylvestris]XP_022849640.1 uncharacterized protein LOC111371737 isoform X1 [Olea europaea var. sylvestris]
MVQSFPKSTHLSSLMLGRTIVGLDETLFKEYEYLIERAKEQQLPKDNPLEEIPIDDPDVKINIMMSVLGTKPCRRILGLGDGCLRDIAILSSNVHTLGKELEAECAARKVANAARVNMEQNKLKVFEQQFNSTLQSWYHSMHQLCGKVPGFIVPPFIPLSIENTGNGKDDAIEDEENDFGENQCMSNLRD